MVRRLFHKSLHLAHLLVFLRSGIPIALRVVYRKRFKRGPFHLGPFSYPVAITACVWILFISIAFILPTANPINAQTLNYSIVAVGIVVTYSVGFWLISARKWFTGPIKQIAGTFPELARADRRWRMLTTLVCSGVYGH